MKAPEIYRFFQTYAMPMLTARYGAYLGHMAAGLVGHGSECFGYDDEVSADHDYDTGFYIWLDDETMSAIGDDLRYHYLHLPHQRATHSASDVGRGVVRIADFYRSYTGLDGAPTTWRQWLSLDDAMLAEATNGSVYFDNLGAFSTLRTTLSHYPPDIRLHRLAAHLLLAAQAGQYNFARCIQHGEEGAAVLALHQFVTHITRAVFLLADRHAPYYKWVMRALGEFPLGAAVHPLLLRLLTGAHTTATMGVDADLIEQVCALVKAELRRQDLSVAPDDYLVPHAYQVRRHIRSDEVRALHILYGV